MNTWDPNNPEVKNQGAPGTDFEVFAGLYLYSGFGMGYFYHPDGTKVWSTWGEACNLAKELGVEMNILRASIEHNKQKRGV